MQPNNLYPSLRWVVRGATCLSLWLLGWIGLAADWTPIPQSFRQEVAQHWTAQSGLPRGPVQLVEVVSGGTVRAFAGGQWHVWDAAENAWQIPADMAALVSDTQRFPFWNTAGELKVASLPSTDVVQLLRREDQVWIVTRHDVFQFVDGALVSTEWEGRGWIHQAALSPDGRLVVASADGLLAQLAEGWVRVPVLDGGGRLWAVQDALGVAFDTENNLWVASRAGVACRTVEGWKFYEGKDGLPWNEFTGLSAGPDGEMWMGTRLGAIRWDKDGFHYRQGPRWLPHDEVSQIGVDAEGRAWMATPRGVGLLERRQMTLAEKAAHYEQEIERYVKRTPYGFVAEAALKVPAQRDSADPHDSDNDGLWTAMYGAGECFAFGATRDPLAGERARKAFEALRFLQKVTQGGEPAPPKGYVARTVRSVELPDPNIGRVEADRRARERGDRLWKVYEPRWPKSADGKWFWKSDTSSDELDGHYFFYPLYHDLVAETVGEKERVREVVRDLTDHLLAHRYVLMDHDGTVTRWGQFSPEGLNHDPNWWPERGLNSLSMLSYLTVAAHVTGDMKYEAAARELIDRHGYAHNAMFPKVQHGFGSGNQSDDEMAFMCFYSLLRYSRDEKLKTLMRFSFYRYWINEAPEMNPFFDFAHAAQNLGAETENPWGRYSIAPWPEWIDNSAATLKGFPLDRLNWSHKNSHRLDLVMLPPQQSIDAYDVGRGTRGYRVNGKVLPVENRHFGHWNTDPWRLDYGGGGEELSAGTVFLLPYYMGLYHGFIEKP